MRRWVGPAAAVLLVAAGACTNPNRDAEDLRRFVRASDRSPKAYTYRVAAEDQEYTVRVMSEDQLRYSMVLLVNGEEVVDFVIRDDALAVRIRNPEFAARLANVLGDDVVDAALRRGSWVVDPAGAPPLVRTEVATGREFSGDPFRDAQEALRFVEMAMGQAREVWQFTLEDIEYRSAIDPWRYPGDDEVRYDLRRPFLPTAEAQTLGAQGDIGPAQFRKTSAFVQGNRISEVCSVIDVLGHEEFITLRERGPESNPFLADLIERIRRKETAFVIEPRYVHVELEYPEGASVELPEDALVGRLDTFMAAFEGAVGGGLLRPQSDPDTRDCRRVEDLSG